MDAVKRPLGESRKYHDVQSHLEEIAAIAKPCWLGVSVQRSDSNPNRSPEGVPLGDGSGNSMDRFVFMGDCFTSMDGEIAADGSGFTIIYNGHQRGRYVEDGAFHGPAWEIGKFIPWELMKLAASYYVALANLRVEITFPYHDWPPIPNKVHQS